ncbi:nucleolar protein 58-like [Lolium rigidum]|uniref:nucleolar protein 58-like n=1 Tax=Lolium rigidum TaxID=89674 RepID=UPI001F5DC511|nr:nucleolar protein 58-like [Lolium rigidum]
MKLGRLCLYPPPPAKRRRWSARSLPAKQRRGDAPHYVSRCGEDELVLLLFETPSGFTIFTFCALLFDEPDPMEFIWAQFAENWSSNMIVWPNEFQTFEDKSSAINENTGVNERLAEMIMKHRCPGQKMAVGKPEYKRIIEERLGIPCLYGPIVMELMWGIQKWLSHSVPGEKSRLTEDDRLPLSQGLQNFLSRYDCNVKPEMVNDKIIKTAAFLFFECDSIEKDNYVALRKAADHIKNLSGISCEDWGLLKIAIALKIVCWPEEAGNAFEMISEDVVSKLVKDAPLYENVLDMDSCLGIYNHMMYAHKVRIKKKELLKSLIEEAKEAYEAG